MIAVGQSRTSKLWKNTEISWEDFVKRLETTTRTPETQGEYFNMAKGQQDAIKDVGGFVGGRLKNGRRKAESVDKRYILTLDADFATEDFCDTLRLFSEYTWCVYSTHKHTPEKPRLRLLIPLSRAVSPDEYEAVARRIAADIGIDMFDDTTYQAHRLMYWPSTSIDGDYIFDHEENEPLDVDKILGRYADWKDISSWPTSSRTIKIKERLLKKQEDPTSKAGIIGAFCRTYTVEEAMEKFLPEVYAPCSIDGRYTYSQGSTAAGVIVYDDSKFVYSNHATDPISGVLCNAFDMVRLHLYGDADEDATTGTPIIKMPSFLKMTELAKNDESVKLTVFKEKQSSIEEDFGEFVNAEEPEEEDDRWALELEPAGKNGYAGTINNCKLILEHDRMVKGKIALNEFTKKYKLFGVTPWSKEDKEKDWTDADDAGLRHYLEKGYGIKGKGVIEDAWTLVAQQNKYHPVRDYLNSLTWDGEKRLETLLIDYLGADDNQYIRAVTRKALVAAVARIFVPGIKYDTMLVLVGKQGCGKSQIIKRLGKDWFSDTLTTVQGKEAYEQIQGFWIIEVAELAAMKRMEVEAIKHFTAKSEDAYRAAYGHHVETYKRQCIFFGTTNKYEFLRDMTGNRRFWPVDVNGDKATKDMWTELNEDTVDLIWAEAVELFKQGEKIYFEDEHLKALAEAEQDRHLEESPMTGDIKMYLEKLLPENWEEMDLSARRGYYQGNDFGVKVEGTVPREKVCALEIWCELFGGDKKDLQRQRSMEINDIIMKTGEWEQTKHPITFGELYGKQRGFIYRNGNKV